MKSIRITLTHEEASAVISAATDHEVMSQDHEGDPERQAEVRALDRVMVKISRARAGGRR